MLMHLKNFLWLKSWSFFTVNGKLCTYTYMYVTLLKNINYAMIIKWNMNLFAIKSTTKKYLNDDRFISPGDINLKWLHDVSPMKFHWLSLIELRRNCYSFAIESICSRNYLGPICVWNVFNLGWQNILTIIYILQK